ncbi:MAG: hypothetical protein D6762_04455 [Candidatus Neomarinimicrobiota bacterium]|nr:MAG: hypothetical protein D6762_04455 [Candidatus Neomarinimicrobiota bacterium]
MIFSLVSLWGQDVTILNPLPNSVLQETDVLIATSFYGVENLDPARVRLVLDGFDVTGGATIDADMLSFVAQSLAPGAHTVEIHYGNAPDGSPLQTSWGFTVTGAEASAGTAFGVEGKFTSGLQYDQIDEQSLGVSRAGLSLKGYATDWIKFRTDVKLTSEEDPLLQPRNKYTLGLEFGPWLKVTLGDANPRYSTFTVNGKRVRGWEADLALGPLGFQLTKGEINRAVQGANHASYTWSDFSLEEGINKIELGRQGYTFRQQMEAYRLYLGKGKYGRWGFNLLKIRDDIASVDQVINSAVLDLEQDTLGLDAGSYTLSELLALNGHSNYEVVLRDPVKWTGATPQDNLVVGSDLGIYIDHKRILLEGEFAFSLLNRNIWDGAFSKAQLDTLMDDTTDNSVGGFFDLGTLPINPQDLSDWFIINQYMSPLIPIDLALFSDSSSVTPTEAIFSMPSLALRGRMAINYFGNFFSLEYSQVGPEYTSLANPYLLKDNREISVNDKIRLLRNRLMLTVGYKRQSNDILPTVTHPKVQTTLNTNVNFLPGPNLPNINLSVRQIDRTNGITTLDTLISETTGEVSYSDDREKNRTLNIVTTVNHRFDLLGFSHNITANVVQMKKEDQLSNRNLDTTFIDPGVIANVYSLNLVTRYRIPLKTVLAFSTTHSEFYTGPGLLARQDLSKFSLDGEYSGLMQESLTLLAGANLANGQGNTEFTWIGFKGGLRWKVIENLSFNALGEYRVKNTPGGSSSTVIGRANLTYLF